MRDRVRWLSAVIMLGLVLGNRAARAQAPADSAHAGVDHSAMHHDMAGMDMGDHDHAMPGLYGPYPMTREASGTSWQPDAGRHSGVHVMRGAWMLMFH